MKDLAKYLVAIAFAAFTPLNIQAQDAFYIYQNDGHFNGFFYDEVQKISYSKLDTLGFEHENFVSQEVVTADSVYRIMLSAIDSVGFVQPDIEFNDRFYEIYGEDFPYSCYFYYFDKDDPYKIHWDMSYFYDEPHYRPESVPKPGDVLHTYGWMGYDPETQEYSFYDGLDGVMDGLFVGKVKEVIQDPDDPREGKMLLICEPITNIGDVFKQFVAVEDIGYDNSGNVRRRIAGANKIEKISGNKELTIASLSGTFPVEWKPNDDFAAVLGIDVGLQMKGRVAYNVSMKSVNVNITLMEDASLGVSLTTKGKIEDVTMLPLVGLPIPFPSFLPIFTIDPRPGSFIKVAGELDMKISSPKFAFHGVQTINISDKGVTGDCQTTSHEDEEDDKGWGLELSLNGSTHAGTVIPFSIGTSSWFSKVISATVETDFFLGPKFEAAFTLDPVALASGDAYNSLKNTHIAFTPFCAAYESYAKYSIGGKKEQKVKVFEGEGGLGKMQIDLFPGFQNNEIGTPVLSTNTSYYTYRGDGTAYSIVPFTVHPTGLSLPCYIGARVYNAAKEIVSTTYFGTADENYNSAHTMYSLFNTFKEVKYQMPMLDGTYTIVPMIKAFDIDIPVWSGAKQVDVEMPIGVTKTVDSYYLYKDDPDFEKFAKEGVIQVYGLMFEDQVEIEFTDGLETYFSPGIHQRNMTEGYVEFTEIGREGDRYATEQYGHITESDKLDFGAEKTIRRNFKFKVKMLPDSSAYTNFRVVATRNGRTRQCDCLGFNIPNAKDYE